MHFRVTYTFSRITRHFLTISFPQRLAIIYNIILNPHTPVLILYRIQIPHSPIELNLHTQCYNKTSKRIKSQRIQYAIIIIS